MTAPSRIVLLAALAALGFAGCDDTGDVFDDAVPADFRVAATALDGFGDVATTFAPGEAVTLRLTVVNATDAYQTLTFESSQIYDFVVEDATGAEIWRWSDGLLFSPADDRIDFRPRQTVFFDEVWGQVSRDGSAVPPGVYGFTAILTAESPGMLSESGTFTIQ